MPASSKNFNWHVCGDERICDYVTLVTINLTIVVMHDKTDPVQPGAVQYILKEVLDVHRRAEHPVIFAGDEQRADQKKRSPDGSRLLSIPEIGQA